MSHSIEIFVASDLPLKIFARELETLLPGQLTEAPHDASRWTGYEGQGPGIFVEVYEHEFENDDEWQIRFADYQYVIYIVSTIDNWVDRERRLNKYARLLFNKLKEQNKYPIMMTDNVQTKLDEYTPDSC